MAQAQAHGGRRRILRIGVLLGGKIVEERLIRERVDVSLGQSAKNTFSIPIEGLPRQFVIFQVAPNGRYVLNFTNAMDGRVSDGERVLTLDAARQAGPGGAQRTAEGFTLPMGEHARGKVSIGELTLLFQFVAEPPVQPRPMLPHSVRGTLADRLEPQLMICLAVSITLHFGFMLWALVINDPDLGGGLAERAAKATFKEESYEVRDEFVLPLEPTEVATTGETKAEEPKPADKPKPAAGDDKPKPADKPGDSGRKDNDAVALQEESKAYADMLFSEDESGSGFSGDMERRKPGGDLGKQLDEVAASGQQTSTGGGSADRGPRGGGPRTGTGTGPTVTGPGGPTTVDPGGKQQEKVPAGRISVSDKKTFDDSSLTPDAVLRKILGAYMSGLKRCHKDLLKKDPTARGKVKLAFTVNESGRTVSPKASGFNPDLDQCIEGLMNSWRFDVPKDSDGDPTEASFEIALQLVPE
jgi:outer membrane biosynthesis protein TonB